MEIDGGMAFDLLLRDESLDDRATQYAQPVIDITIHVVCGQPGVVTIIEPADGE